MMRAGGGIIMKIYQRIRESNRIKYGTESEKILKIIINQYSDRTHFIYEILQNAEDAGASQIRFHLTENALEIYHNGRPFDEKDIEGVCGIANGTKEDGTRIGHFGIGFKSVYCYTEIPKIYSGSYHFEICSQLFPQEIVKLQGLSNQDTGIVLPFNRVDVPAKIAYDEIKEALIKRITSDSILMLNNIEKVSIEIDGFENEIEIIKQKSKIGDIACGSVCAVGVAQIANKGKKNEEGIYRDFLLFTDNKKESSAIVFRVGGKDGREIIPIKNSKVYAYFPTARESHQNFYIHAPFDTTPARDNFKEGSDYGKHNIELIENICDIITDSLIWMRDNNYLSLSSFNTVFPIYEYDKTDILYGIYENSIAIVNSGFEILPTNIQGTYKAVEDICVPQAANIVDVFSDDDLHQLLDHQKYWIAKEIVFERYSELRRFLKENFELKIIDWPALVLKMDAFFLKQKKIGWMERLMGTIESYSRKSAYDSHFINVSRIPLVRTTRGEQICAQDENGRLQVYLNNPDNARYKIDEGFRKNEIINSFYKNALKIPVYNATQEVMENILPHYWTKDVKRTIKENIEDLKVIKDALYENPEIKNEIADKFIVTNGNDWFFPSDTYIRNNDVRSGFALMKGIIKINYLSESYFDDTIMNIRLDEKFFSDIGCNTTIRELAVTKEKYLYAVKKYIGSGECDVLRRKIFSKTYQSGKLDWSFCYEGFELLFENMDFEKSLKIAKFLNVNHAKIDIQGEIVAANDRFLSGSSVDSMVAYSMIGLYLCFEKWIYVNENDNPQRPIDVERSDLRPRYEQTKRIIEMLPFKEINNALFAFLEANISDKSELELTKRFVRNPEDLVSLAKAKAANEAREAKRKNKGIHDLIREGNRLQKERKSKTDDFEVNPISEQGKKRREESLEKSLAESMDYKTSVAKGLQFTSHTSNKEERQFLLSEYSGHCQMCKKQIIKHDGNEYFEAINIIKFSELRRDLESSSHLGWNSLCLCPNCAAEYNYCSKRISSFYEQVMDKDVASGSDEPIDIQIELPENQIRIIHYSPRHFIALKKAFEVFTEK